MNIAAAKKALKQYFGYESFRPLQEAIINQVYANKDILVLMPTGGGKSICYQLPAVTLKGTCIVVSPLIALMKDQVEGLNAIGIRAAFLNSTQSYDQQLAIERELQAGELKLLYVSPEKLMTDGFFNFLSRLEISMIAVDEAHCVSEWGHDFRPEYAQLDRLKRTFTGKPIIALTATADKVTRKDIIKQLGLEQPETFIASFDRPNLGLTVLPGRDRFRLIKSFVQQRPGTSGIIYCNTRKSTEQLSEKLRNAGITAAAYHAGMTDVQRSRTQEAFINDQVPIICATIAFGMGIDKSNVRWIIHYNLPKNIESFYQQIGRAGRDGVNSETLLFYSFADVMLQRQFIEESSQKDLLMAKLDRMMQYADALICRRKILLSYFNEHLDNDCGNCDVCENPPEHFDGTVIAQKALSAIFRLKESVGLNLLVDVLRGSGRAEIMRRGFNKIKTYGAGRNHSNYDWQQFLLQMLNLGLIELAYDDNYTLKLTEASQEVLFKGKKVKLVKLASIKEKIEQRVAKAKPKTKKELVKDELFEILRALRKELAAQRRVPPYRVFSDATLMEMAAEKPVTRASMLQISGVGETKLQQYADHFIAKILDYLSEKEQKGEKVSGSTLSVTLDYYKKGFTPEKIATQRNIKIATIFEHLHKLYQSGEDIEVHKFISEQELRQIAHAVKATQNNSKLKDLYDDLNQEIPYHKLRFALSYLKNNPVT
ncbi:MAG: DNA helicase RecQ [Bacteroidota bacterium]